MQPPPPTTATTTTTNTTRLDALLLEPGLASLIVAANMMAPAAPQRGMLAMLNQAFRRAFKDIAAEAREAFKALEDDRRFLAISAFVTRDMVTRLNFEEDSDADFDDRSARGFCMLLYHEKMDAHVYINRGTDCAVLLESELDHYFPIIHVRTPEDWARCAPLMRIFKSKRHRRFYY
jgi:hypothetical protein